MFGRWYSIGEFLEDLRALSDTFECDRDSKELILLIEKFEKQDS